MWTILPARRRLIVKPSGRAYLLSVTAVTELCQLAAALERLLVADDPGQFERVWEELALDRLAWEALALARRADTAVVEHALAQVDRLLLALLERCRAVRDDPHIMTFRVPELERWQHAAAAALVGARWGVAGLRTVIADTAAPLDRKSTRLNSSHQSTSRMPSS